VSLLMSGSFIAIVANALIGLSLVWDKILLLQPATRSLANYVFWLGALSILGLLLIPFGFVMPSARMAVLAFAAGMIHLAAVWFYYAALKSGEASQTLAVMGGFSPLATALAGLAFLAHPLDESDWPGFVLMLLGGFLMFLTESLHWRRVVPDVLLSSGLFGISNVLLKLAFDRTGFVSGYVLFTLGTCCGALALLVRPRWRKQIVERSEEAPARSRFLYFLNRLVSGVGSFLIFFAISRGSPVIIEGVSGIRYIVIFLGAYLVTRLRPDWLQEDFRRRALVGKSIATALIVAGLVIVARSGRQDARSDPLRVASAPPCAAARLASRPPTRRKSSGIRHLLLLLDQ
jgi:drug/metabolite transporter (DMT)-like permease